MKHWDDIERNRNRRIRSLAEMGAACMIEAFLQWTLYVEIPGEQLCLCKEYAGTGSLCFKSTKSGCCRRAFYDNFLRHKS